MATIKVSKNTLTKNPPLYRGGGFFGLWSKLQKSKKLNFGLFGLQLLGLIYGIKTTPSPSPPAL